MIKDLVGKSGKVFCFDEENLKNTISNFYDVRMTGENSRVYQLEMEDGRIIKATDYHPILTDKGWKLLKDLKVGDNIVDIAESLK